MQSEPGGSPSPSTGSRSSSPSPGGSSGRSGRPRPRAAPPPLYPPPGLGDPPAPSFREPGRNIPPPPASMIKGCQNECTGGGCSGETGKQMTESFKVRMNGLQKQVFPLGPKVSELRIGEGLRSTAALEHYQHSTTNRAMTASDLIITPATTFKEKPDPTGLVFGTVFTDNMLTIEWSLASGWEKPCIKPLENLSLHPASSALHYAVELFEGMKAYRGVDGKIRLFRPTLNMDRMARSARRTTLPPFDQNELLECIRKLVEVEQEWVPYSTSASLYIRPTLIGTEPSLGVKKPTKALLYVILSPVGPYFASGSFNPISLWADPKYVRAWKGGTGDCKVGGNYGSSIYAQQEALEFGCQQVLWLYGEDHQITEVGTMNLFLYWINEDGENELATPPLDGIILPGVTRQSILDLARNWGEFKVSERYITMSDLTAALEENRVKEMFGAGTACIVCPISKILYKGEHLHIPTMENGPELTTRFLNKLSDIQYGREDSDWTVLVS